MRFVHLKRIVAPEAEEFPLFPDGRDVLINTKYIRTMMPSRFHQGHTIIGIEGWEKPQRVDVDVATFEAYVMGTVEIDPPIIVASE